MNTLKQNIISPKKRGTLTEPHMFRGTLWFRGTPVEEHWCRSLFPNLYLAKHHKIIPKVVMAACKSSEVRFIYFEEALNLRPH